VSDATVAGVLAIGTEIASIVESIPINRNTAINFLFIFLFHHILLVFNSKELLSQSNFVDFSNEFYYKVTS
jgi:hypothetical protein